MCPNKGPVKVFPKWSCLCLKEAGRPTSGNQHLPRTQGLQGWVGWDRGPVQWGVFQWGQQVLPGPGNLQCSDSQPPFPQDTPLLPPSVFSSLHHLHGADGHPPCARGTGTPTVLMQLVFSCHVGNPERAHGLPPMAGGGSLDGLPQIQPLRCGICLLVKPAPWEDRPPRHSSSVA